MDSSRRWLVIFACVVGALVVASTVLALITSGKEADLLPEGTPEGTVQRYLVALQEGELRQAYDYLHFDSSQRIESYDDWLDMVSRGRPAVDMSSWKATLGRASVGEDTASVSVTIETFRPSGPFENPVRSQQINFELVLLEDNWLIASPVYVYWLY